MKKHLLRICIDEKEGGGLTPEEMIYVFVRKDYIPRVGELFRLSLKQQAQMGRQIKKMRKDGNPWYESYHLPNFKCFDLSGVMLVKSIMYDTEEENIYVELANS